VQQQGQGIGTPDGAVLSSSAGQESVSSGGGDTSKAKRIRSREGGKGKRLSKMNRDHGGSSDEVKSASTEDKKRPAIDDSNSERPSKMPKSEETCSSEKNDDLLVADSDLRSDELGPDELVGSIDSTSSAEAGIASLRDSIKLSPSDITNKLLPLVQDLINDECGWVFSSPVDPVELGLPDYFDIIKNPMDLGTVEKNLQSGLYDSVATVERDVKLVFENSILYNGEGSDVGIMAKQLMDKFIAAFKALLTGLRAGQI